MKPIVKIIKYFVLKQKLSYFKMFDIVDKTQYLSILQQNKHHFDHLLNIIQQSNESLEGNCFYNHSTTTLAPDLINKQINIFSIAKHSHNILEIGFNAGHSTLLFLLANTTSHVTCFDICEHKYTIPCFNYIDNHFPGRVTLYKGDANQQLSKLYLDKWNKSFDLFHIDGPHNSSLAHINFLWCRKFANKGNIIIWDDIDIPTLNLLWENYKDDQLVTPFHLLHTPQYPHALGIFN
ncbi:unnamed protein product, partial [marine sediment metagenome]